MSTSPQPGWYADPEDPSRRRWWDGSRWTEHVEGGPRPSGGGGGASGNSSRQWAMTAHLSALVGLFIGFSFVGPLVVYLIKRDDDPFVRDQAAEALNFNLSYLLYLVITGLVTIVLLFVIVGVLLIPVMLLIVIAWLVLTILASVRASRGEAYRYPLTIRFVR